MNHETCKPADFVNFDYEFNDTLSFVLEICEVPFAFITYRDALDAVLIAKMGFDAVAIPEAILLHSEDIIKKNSTVIIPDLRNDLEQQFNHSTTEADFCFFVGLPLVDDQNLAVGSICILDLKAKELTFAQLKSLEYAAKQVSFKLKAFEQNRVQCDTIREKAIQFQLFIDNSKEVIYEIDFDGVFSYVCENWTTFLGYEVDETLGKNIASFIHPEDIEMFKDHFNTIAAARNSKKELVYRILHKDGHAVWHSSNLNYIEKKGMPFFIGNCRDITAHQVTEQKYLAQKEFYEKILNEIPTDVAVFDQDHKYLYVNQAAIKDDELRAFIKGKDDFEYSKHTGRDDSTAKQRRAKFLHAMESKNVIQWEDHITNPTTGLTTYHDRKLNPVFDKNGSFDVMIGFGVDITERKKIQEEILKNKQLLSSILDNIAVGILVQGPQSEILENNKAACDMLGLTEDQLIGKTSFDTLWKVIHLDGSNFLPEDHPVPLAIKLLRPVKNVVMGVYRPVSIDLVWLLVDAIPVFDDLGKLLYVVCSFNDITELKNIEDELTISNERFRYSSEATSDAIWDWDLVSDDVLVTVSYYNLFGHQFKDNILKSQEMAILIHPEDRESCIADIEKTLENKSTTKWCGEYRYCKSDGSYAYVTDKAIIIRDEKGKAVRMIGATQDITSRKKLENELQQSEEQFKGAFEHSPVGMALVDVEGFYIEVNDRLCEMLGYSQQEMKLLTFQEITYHEDLKVDLEYKEDLDSEKISNFGSEKRFIQKNKSILWAYISVSLVKNSKNEKYYVVQVIDINERKKIEQQNKLLTEENNKNKAILLNEAENMYRFLAENSADLICLHHLDTTFQYISPSVINILGYKPEELQGKSPLEYVHPDDIEDLLGGFTDFAAKKVNENNTSRFRTKDGHYIWIETRATILEKNGVISGFQSSSRDITTRKEEEEATEKALAKERELNELRTNLVSTISHEFRTPMTTIRTSAELISIYLEGLSFEKKPRLEKQLNTITGEIDRIVELMNSVLIISKDDSGKTNFKPVPFDLKQLCLDVIDTSFDNQMNGSKVQTYITGENFPVFADKNLMEYSIFNVLNNAFKYSQGSSDVVLQLSASSSTITLQIIDKGIGIPKEDQHKLFNTFFRASNTNGIPGTGLGLYIVKTFTEKNAGTIKLESILGKGTTITLQFPVLKP